MRVAVIQMPVLPDKLANIEKAASYVAAAARAGADMAVLPEMFCCPYQTANFPRYAEKEGGEHWSLLARAAKDSGIYLVAGSMPELDADGRVFNTSYVFDRLGRPIARHRKMHLFDISVSGGQHFKESDTLTPGNQVTVFTTEFCKIGLAICYDFRFPELCRLMSDQGAKVMIIPAAFNMTTGPAHWEILFRLRAVDNQVFTVGAAPARQLGASYISYGNSIVVSPWGDVLARLDENEGMALADLDLTLVDNVRRELPLLAHRRQDLYNLAEISPAKKGVQ